MARYIARPQRTRSDDYGYYEPPLLTNIEVTESDPVWTGLLDEHGNDIMRINDPIGFRLDEEDR